MAIVINGSGTVTGISVGGLPDGIVDAGTLATDSVDSAELINGAIDAAHLASGVGGKVLQVVQLSATISRTTISSTATWTTHFGVAITPSATSSKILVLVTQPTSLQNASGNIMRGGFRLLRDSTTVWNTGDFTELSQARNADSESNHNISVQYLDSPSTTSATTYNFQGNLMTGDALLMYESVFGTNMILMEIAG